MTIIYPSLFYIKDNCSCRTVGGLIFILTNENQTDEMQWNILILWRDDNIRDDEFSEKLFLYFMIWERTGCRSKLSNHERRWPSTDVSNILVFGLKRLSRTALENSIRWGTYFGRRETTGVRAGMFKALSTKAPAVSTVRQSVRDSRRHLAPL